MKILKLSFCCDAIFIK